MTDRSNLVGREPPTPTDDVNKGYGVGSRWTDKIHNRKYTCTDATNQAAVWIEDMADVTDAASVKDAEAVMDSDFEDNDGFMRKTGEGAYEVIKSNMEASTAPTTADDSNSGYAVGSRWFDITNDKEYVCLDATAGAAVWIETTASVGDRTRTFFVGAHYYTEGGQHLLGIALDSSTDEKVAYRFQLPADFVSLTSVQVCWSNVTWNTVNRNWVLDVAVRIGVPPYIWNQHGGTDIGNVIAYGAYENYLLNYFSIASGCFTNIDKNDICTVILDRDANSGSDTFTEDIMILGLKVTYTADM